MKKIIMSWLLSFLVMFGLAGIFNSIIIADFVSENISSELLQQSPNMIFIIAGYTLLALLMTLLFSRVVNENQYSVKYGFVFGVFSSIFWLLPYSLVLHGVYNFPSIALLIDSGWALIEQGLGGVVIALVHKKLTKNNA